MFELWEVKILWVWVMGVTLVDICICWDWLYEQIFDGGGMNSRFPAASCN